MALTLVTKSRLEQHALMLVIGSGSALVLVAMLELARDAPDLLAAYGTSTALATVLGLVLVDRGAQMQVQPHTPLRPFLARRALTGPVLLIATLLYAVGTDISVTMSALAAFVVASTTLRDIAMLRLASTNVPALLLSAVAKGVLALGLGLVFLAGRATDELAIAALLASPAIDAALTLLVVLRPRDAVADTEAAVVDLPTGPEYTLAPAAGAAIINVDLLLAPQILDAPAAALYVFWHRVSAAIQLPSDAAARKILAQVLPAHPPRIALALGTAGATFLALAITTAATGHALSPEHLAAIGLLSAAAGLRSSNALVGASLSRTARQRPRFTAMLIALAAAVVLSGTLLPLLAIAGAALARLGTEAVLSNRYGRAAE